MGELFERVVVVVLGASAFDVVVQLGIYSENTELFRKIEHHQLLLTASFGVKQQVTFILEV